MANTRHNDDDLTPLMLKALRDASEGLVLRIEQYDMDRFRYVGARCRIIKALERRELLTTGMWLSSGKQYYMPTPKGKKALQNHDGSVEYR